MEIIREPKVTLLARQQFLGHPDIDWKSDSDIDPQQLVEFAGRLCYMSFGKDAQVLGGHKTIEGRTTNQGYIANLLQVKHGSVLEHAAFTFLFEGISRALTHELVRHRAGFGYSQLSQRFVDESNIAFVLPPEVAEGTPAFDIWKEACENSLQHYRKLLEQVTEQVADEPNATLRRKRARQAARAVLPNSAETKIVVTANARAWRHFIELRASAAADAEIRKLAIAVLRVLQREAPDIFGDFKIEPHEDGTETASTPYSKV
ncbi:MAG: FAD-dependent thymidylate synthase [Gemmatimonadota bacterium]|nr:MAG: FAD-dependent thymidylate synthase [Gemmatimonadota bacterium]